MFEIIISRADKHWTQMGQSGESPTESREDHSQQTGQKSGEKVKYEGIKEKGKKGKRGKRGKRGKKGKRKKGGKSNSKNINKTKCTRRQNHL